MLFLDGAYVERPDGSLALPLGAGTDQRRACPTDPTLALRIGRYLERQRLLERDAENSYLAGDRLDAGRWISSWFVDHLPHRHWAAAGPQGVPCRHCRRVKSPSMTGWARRRILAACRGGGAGGATAEARAATQIHQSTGNCGKAPVAHPKWQCPPSAEDAVPRRDDARHLEPLDSSPVWRPLVPKPRVNLTRFPRGFCAQQQTPRAGDPGQARQGRPASHEAGSRGGYASRTPRRDDLGERLKRVFGIDIATCPACGGQCECSPASRARW